MIPTLQLERLSRSIWRVTSYFHNACMLVWLLHLRPDSKQLILLSLMSGYRNFRAIEGIRVILSFWVVLFHSFTMLTYVSNDAVTLNRLKTAPWGGAVRLFGAQVDVFFVLSGFLTSIQLLEKCESDSFNSFSGISFLLKKLLRFWPIPIVVGILSYCINDFGASTLYPLMWKIINFQMDEATAPIASVPLWSNRVEIVASTILVAIFFILSSQLLGPRGKYIALGIIGLSIIPSSIVFFRHTELSASYMLSLPNTHIPVYMTTERVNWLQTRFGISLASAGGGGGHQQHWARMSFGNLMYLPFWARWTPFFMGLYMAIALKQWQREHAKIDSSPATVTSLSDGPLPVLSSPQLLGRALRLATSCVACAVLLSPALMGVYSAKLVNVSSFDLPLPCPPLQATWTDYFLTVLMRQLFAAAAGYFIYCCVVPDRHPLHFSALQKCLSLSWLRCLGPYTYGVYAIHFRILFELIFSQLTPGMVDVLLGSSERGFAHVMMYACATYVLSLAAAWILHHFIETPLNRLVIEPLFKIEFFNMESKKTN